MFGSPSMTRSSSTRVALIGLALGLCAACSDKESARANSDSSLARDLALANAQTSAAPTFQDTANAPAPAPASRAQERTERPAPVRTHTARRPEVQPPPRQHAAAPPPTTQAPPVMPAATPAPLPAPAPGPARGEIGSGSTFALTNGTKVCTSNVPGDKIVATLNESVTGSNGAVIPSGSTVVLEVASVTPGENGNDPR